MRVVCRDWAKGQVHQGILVIRDDGQGGPDTDTICYECLWRYREANGLGWLNAERNLNDEGDTRAEIKAAKGGDDGEV